MSQQAFNDHLDNELRRPLIEQPVLERVEVVGDLRGLPDLLGVEALDKLRVCNRKYLDGPPSTSVLVTGVRIELVTRSLDAKMVARFRGERDTVFESGARPGITVWHLPVAVLFQRGHPWSLRLWPVHEADMVALADARLELELRGYEMVEAQVPFVRASPHVIVCT